MPQNQFPSSRCSGPGLPNIKCLIRSQRPSACSKGCETGNRPAGTEFSRLERQRLPFKTLPNATDMESDVILKLRFAHAERRVFVDHCECRMHGTVEAVEIPRLERTTILLKAASTPELSASDAEVHAAIMGLASVSAPVINLS